MRNNRVYPTNYNNYNNNDENTIPIKILSILVLMCIIFGFL